MKILYAVPWVDSEPGWGTKFDEYQVFDDLEDCITRTKEASKNGPTDSGCYYGPERPLHYIETNDEIEGTFPQWIKSIKFKGSTNLI